MAYSDLNQNQTVSFNNLQSGVTQGAFTAKTTIPSSAKQITKTEANTYINIDTSLPSFVAKASNQLITKQDLSGVTVVTPYLMYGVGNTFGYKSIDGGSTWTSLSGLPSLNWTGIAGDSTGTYIAVICQTQNNQIYISNDSGATFNAVTISYILIGFYATGVAMSKNGQYICVSGCSTSSNSPIGFNRNARIATSNDYGASFGAGSYTDGTGLNLYNISGKVSVSGNGQYMTAVFGYRVDPGGVGTNPRPWSFRVYSSNYGVSWTKSGGSEFCAFLDIALDNTGQNQLITSDWIEPGFTGSRGIKAFVSNNYGSSWTQKYSNTTEYYLGGAQNSGFVSATISDNGQTMVGATNAQVYFEGMMSSTSPRVIASINSGTTFSSTEGYTNNIGITGGDMTTSGITNNFISMLLSYTGQYNYSVNGGITFTPKSSANIGWTQLYRKAFYYITGGGGEVTYYTYYISPTDFTGQPSEYGCGSYDENFAQTVYSSSPTFLGTTRFYTDTALTTPFNGNDSTAVWWTDSYFENGCSIRISSSGYNVDQYCC